LLIILKVKLIKLRLNRILKRAAKIMISKGNRDRLEILFIAFSFGCTIAHQCSIQTV